MPYVLDVSDGSLITDPTDDQIRQAVMGLESEDDGAFVILNHTDETATYIQSAGDSAPGFELEYQVGGTDQHFRATALIDSEQLIAALIAYRNGDASWQTAREWEQMRL